MIFLVRNKDCILSTVYYANVRFAFNFGTDRLACRLRYICAFVYLSSMQVCCVWSRARDGIYSVEVLLFYDSSYVLLHLLAETYWDHRAIG